MLQKFETRYFFQRPPISGFCTVFGLATGTSITLLYDIAIEFPGRVLQIFIFVIERKMDEDILASNPSSIRENIDNALATLASFGERSDKSHSRVDILNNLSRYLLIAICSIVYFLMS